MNPEILHKLMVAGAAVAALNDATAAKKRKPTWIIESNVFAETSFDQMIAHFKATDTPYHVVRIIPFVHEIDGPVPQIEGPCVVYGSIGVQKLAAREGWTPGVFGDAKAFSESRAERALGELYLNYGQFKTSIKRLGENPEAFARLLGGLHNPPVAEFFLKPNTDTKEFAGEVIRVDQFVKWYDGMIQSGYLDDNDFDVVVSRPKTLGCEWRVVVVDGAIVTASLYRQYQRVMPEVGLIPEVEAVVKEAMWRYDEPAQVYVIDVAQVRQGDDWTYKVIEYNSFNSAGFYACDVPAIIDAVNALLSQPA